MTAGSPVPPDHHSTRVLVSRLLREEVRPHAGRLALAALLMVVVAAATATTAWLMEPVLDQVFANNDRDMLVLMPLVVLAVFTVKGTANYGQTTLMGYVGHRIVANLQSRQFAHLMDADLSFYHDTATGMLISRLTYDVNLLRAFVSTAFAGIVREPLTIVGLVAVMFYQDWRLATVALFVFPFAILPVVAIGRRMRKVSARTQVHAGKLTAHLDETFQGARHVKAYGMEGYEVRRAARTIEELFRLVYRAVRVRAASTPVMETLGGIAIAVVIFYGGSRVIDGATTTGSFFSFITALLLAYEPMKKLANLNANLQEGLAAAQRVFALLDTAPRITDRPGAQPLAIRGGAVTFDAVHFAYGPGAPALNGVTLTIPAGKTAALVGPSGAGKSTILNLIPRFYDIKAGSVRIDGNDVRDVTLRSLRGAIALVSQEVSLFNDTVCANIAYGRADASEDDIRAAARAAAADEFITALADGYESIVGEHGVKLSGGQRQRIAIARAMLKNAPILLLDEATSSLDSESERLVQEALARLVKGRTTLVIAHRLSTVIDADIIYVMASGRVIESGAHAELLAKNGAYARLYYMQFAEDAEAGGAARARA
ncbi:MAG: ABC transporter transmembrane domain-containing protein [Alphaproteobacteria bacterium]